jgi:hypothetical protein
VLSVPHGESVTVLAEQRNPTTGVSVLVDDRVIAGCVSAPGTVLQSSIDSEHATVTTSRSLFTPPGSGLVTGDRVRFANGTVWEVVADAGGWRSPFTGWAPGDEVQLIRTGPTS